MSLDSHLRESRFAFRRLAIFVCVGTSALTSMFMMRIAVASTAAPVSSDFLYSCNVEGDLFAAMTQDRSTSPYFWVSSGGRMEMREGLCETIQGKLPVSDPSRIEYARVNPLDTGNGYYPQNTFRLVTRAAWGNSEESVRFRITAQNLTNTPNREGYSGVFLFNRYLDKDNLYYAGVRDDGLAIIKKKIGTTYYTLAYTQVFGSFSQFDKVTDPSFLPTWQWMGIKTRVTNNSDGSVTIRLYLDKNDSGNFVQVASYTDRGIGGAPFRANGKGGIRTDYMDVQFDDFSEKAL